MSKAAANFQRILKGETDAYDSLYAVPDLKTSLESVSIQNMIEDEEKEEHTRKNEEDDDDKPTPRSTKKEADTKRKRKRVADDEDDPDADRAMYLQSLDSDSDFRARPGIDEVEHLLKNAKFKAYVLEMFQAVFAWFDKRHKKRDVWFNRKFFGEPMGSFFLACFKKMSLDKFSGVRKKYNDALTPPLMTALFHRFQSRLEKDSDGINIEESDGEEEEEEDEEMTEEDRRFIAPDDEDEEEEDEEGEDEEDEEGGGDDEDEEAVMDRRVTFVEDDDGDEEKEVSLLVPGKNRLKRATEAEQPAVKKVKLTHADVVKNAQAKKASLGASQKQALESIIEEADDEDADNDGVPDDANISPNVYLNNTSKLKTASFSESELPGFKTKPSLLKNRSSSPAIDLTIFQKAKKRDQQPEVSDDDDETHNGDDEESKSNKKKPRAPKKFADEEKKKDYGKMDYKIGTRFIIAQKEYTVTYRPLHMDKEKAIQHLLKEHEGSKKVHYMIQGDDVFADLNEATVDDLSTCKEHRSDVSDKRSERELYCHFLLVPGYYPRMLTKQAEKKVIQRLTKDPEVCRAIMHRAEVCDNFEETSAHKRLIIPVDQYAKLREKAQKATTAGKARAGPAAASSSSSSSSSTTKAKITPYNEGRSAALRFFRFTINKLLSTPEDGDKERIAVLRDRFNSIRAISQFWHQQGKKISDESSMEECMEAACEELVRFDGLGLMTWTAALISPECGELVDKKLTEYLKSTVPRDPSGMPF